MQGAVALVVRNRLRRRWTAVAAVAAITALAGTVTLTALAGARRTSSAVSRALDDGAVADVAVDVGIIDPALVRRVEALPEVRDVSMYVFAALRPAGSDLVAGLELTGVVPVDDRAGITMDRSRYRAGRAPHPERRDEVALNTPLAERLGLDVGDRITVESYRQDQVEALFSGTEEVQPAGARIDGTVVGIGDPVDSFVASGDGAEFGIIQLSRAAWDAYGPAPPVDATEGAPNSELGMFRLVLRARLDGGAADARAYLSHVDEIFDGKAETTFSEDRRDLFRTAADSVRVQSVALLLFALAAGLAGVVAAGQAAARHAAVAAQAEDEQLRAMGLTRRGRTLAAALPPVIGIAFGALAAVAGAAVASASMPRGLARRFDPDLGIDVDPLVLLPGALVLFLLIAGRAVAAGWRGSAPTSSRVVGRPGRIVGALPPPASLGARMAMSRPTLVAAVAAVTGVVAALTFATGLDNLADDPGLSGEPWDAQVILQTNGEEIAAKEEPRLRGDDRIAALSRYGLVEAAVGRADEPVSGFGIARLKGEVAPTLLAGRLPSAPDEIAVDPGVVPGPGPRIGSTVPVQAGGSPVTMTVVGTLTGTGEGFVVTSDAIDALEAEVSDAGFLLRWKPGTDRSAAIAELRRTFADVEPPIIPNRVANVSDARGFPFALGAFLALLGLLAAGHLLVTTVSRRRRDLAVARALGFTTGQARSVALWQAASVAVIAVVLGVPAGLVVGRWAWTAVAGTLRVVERTPIPVGAIAVTVIATFATATLLAAGPGRRFGRIQPARVLRAE